MQQVVAVELEAGFACGIEQYRIYVNETEFRVVRGVIANE